MRGSVAKNKNRWYIYFYVGKDANGKWKKKWEGSWETKREAERALRTRLTALETAAEQSIGAYTVETLLYYWLENYCVPRLKPNTIKGYTTNIEKHTLPTIGAIPLEKLEPKDLQNLYNVLRSKNLSDTSIRYVHNNLHKALDFAVKMQFISKNPADYAVPPVIKHKEFQPLTPNEVTHLLKACVQKEVLLPVILATTLGLRRGEALTCRLLNSYSIHKTLIKHTQAIEVLFGNTLPVPFWQTYIDTKKPKHRKYSFAITVIVILIADIFAFIVLLDRIATYMGGTTLLNMLRF